MPNFTFPEENVWERLTFHRVLERTVCRVFHTSGLSFMKRERCLENLCGALDSVSTQGRYLSDSV